MQTMVLNSVVCCGRLLADKVAIHLLHYGLQRSLQVIQADNLGVSYPSLTRFPILNCHPVPIDKRSAPT